MLVSLRVPGTVFSFPFRLQCSRKKMAVRVHDLLLGTDFLSYPELEALIGKVLREHC